MNKRLLMSVTASVVLIVSLYQQTAGEPLTGKKSSIERLPALPRLTPRPVIVDGIDEVQLNLAGVWRFNPKPPKEFWKGKSPKDAGWSDIEVPGEWVMQGFEVAKNTAAGYVRQFTIPAEWKGRRIKIRFDGVYSDAKVWVNGKKAGAHIGGFTPFELDVTQLVGPGQDNTIALAVKNESLADNLASGTYYAAHQLGGITRKTYLFTVPELNISSLHSETSFDKDYNDAALHLTMDITNENRRDIKDAQVLLKLTDPDNKPVSIEPAIIKLPAIKAGRTIRQTVDIPVAGPKKWDAEHPNLYVLSCQLQAADKSLEIIKHRFGFRQVEVRERQLFVNNTAVKLHGVCRHETHPLRGRSLTPQLCRKDAELFRSANINFIRTSHYPPSEEFLDACDELGIFIEDEAPFCWAFRWALDQRNNPKYRDIIVRQTLEMIQRDRSRPCVILWSAANESEWDLNFEKSTQAIRKVDSSQPLIFSYSRGQNLDVASYHYPGSEIDDELSQFNVPVLFDEYMHLNCYNRSESATDPGIREDWGRALAPVWEKMNAAQECLGGAVWSGLDDIFYLPAGRTTGYGPWGPLDGWRRTKPEYWHIKKAYSPIRIPIEEVITPDKGEPIRLFIENRHGFTNLSEIRIEWSLADETGTVKADIPARSIGIISIQPNSVDIDGKKLSLEFLSPRGFLIDSYLLPVGVCEMVQPAPSISADGTLELVKDDNSFTIKGSRFSYVFDRKTGQIRSAEIDGQTVLVGGPILMVLLFGGGRCEPDYNEDVKPLNNTCSQWQADDVTAEQTTDGIEIRVKGRYKEAAGAYTMLINGRGQLTASYHFTYEEEPKPTEHMWNDQPDPTRYRQLGIVFDLPKSCDTLAWERKAIWSVYPDDHIGRPAGQARAFRDTKWPTIKLHAEPPWPWSLDSTELGTNDFRATRRNILWASLKRTDGYGVLVRSDGRHSTRSYVDGDRIRLLAAGHSTGGRDGVSFGHLGNEQKPLNKGTVLDDTVQLELVGP